MRTTLMLVLSVSVLWPHAVRAQFIYESSTGTSSISLRDGGSAGINFADASVELGYVRAVSTSPWRIGAAAEVESPEGFAELFEGSDFSSPEVSGSLFAGRVKEFEESSLIYSLFGAKLDYTHSNLSLAQKNEEDVISIQEQKFDGATASIFYNAFLEKFIFPEETLLGVALRYGRRNNFGELKKVEVCEEVEAGTSEEGASSAVQACENARTGDYKTNSEFSADLDIIWYQGWTKNRLAFALLGRYNSPEEDDSFVPGFGVFLTLDGSPMKFLGGLTVEHVENDWRLGLQVGFPFS